jgi:hypothetical protein
VTAKERLAAVEERIRQLEVCVAELESRRAATVAVMQRVLTALTRNDAHFAEMLKRLRQAAHSGQPVKVTVSADSPVDLEWPAVFGATNPRKPS